MHYFFRRRRLIASATVLVFTFAACSDVPTGAVSSQRIAATPDAPFRNAIWIGKPHKSMSGKYGCAISERTPSGAYGHGKMWVNFPNSYKAPGGETVLYQLRVGDEGQPPVAAANCRIPKTSKAISAMNKRLSGPVTSSQISIEPDVTSSQGLKTPKETPPKRSPSRDIPEIRNAVLAPPKGGVSADLATVVITASPTYWNGWASWSSNCDWDCEEWVSQGGMDQYYSSYDPGPAPCDPATDPTCYQPLTSADSQAITDSRSSRRETSFTDPSRAESCNAADSTVMKAYAEGRVMRGTSNSAQHTGTWLRDTIHVDRAVFDSLAAAKQRPDAAARYEGTLYWEMVLLGTLYHEGWHDIYKSSRVHADAEAATGYTTWPWNLTDPRVDTATMRNPGSKCIKYYP